MIDAGIARRRRAVAAMGLGPLWIARGSDRREIVPDEERSAAIARMDAGTLARAVSGCRACGLGSTRLRAVVGDGCDRPRLLVVGTAPDEGDEVAGIAFSGGPGRLLDAMLASIGAGRTTDAYVTHRVKCRPPGDRAPTTEETASCRPFLERQAALLEPRLVVALGGKDPLQDGWLAVPDPQSLIDAPQTKAEAWVALCEVRSRSAPT